MSRPDLPSGLQTKRATGQNGLFEGLTADQTVFGTYARTGEWGGDVVHYFTSVTSALPGCLYIDAGANIGLTAVPVAKLETVARTVCIEADPVNQALLRHNLDLNGVDATIAPFAIADREGELVFERDSENFGDHRLQGHGAGLMNEDQRAVLTVSAKPLDTILAGLNWDGPIALKSDIQGAEPMLFRGGAKTLGRTPFALIEYWPYGMARLGEDEHAFRTAIAEHFTAGALIWPHAPKDDPDWQPLPAIFDQIDQVFSGGDTELHKIGCLNLALRKAAP